LMKSSKSSCGDSSSSEYSTCGGDERDPTDTAMREEERPQAAQVCEHPLPRSRPGTRGWGGRTTSATAARRSCRAAPRCPAAQPVHRSNHRHCIGPPSWPALRRHSGAANLCRRCRRRQKWNAWKAKTQALHPAV
jgi:hypothetical protein